MAMTEESKEEPAECSESEINDSLEQADKCERVKRFFEKLRALHSWL